MQRACKRRSAGQVIIEILLVLPLFLMTVFVIMEIGHLAFQTIVVHHAAFELARIGSLVAAPRAGEGFNPRLDRASAKVRDVCNRLFPMRNAACITRTESTLADPQSGQTNHDLIVRIEYRCPLIFPFTAMLFQSQEGPIKVREEKPWRMLYAEVRMPVQQPTFR